MLTKFLTWRYIFTYSDEFPFEIFTRINFPLNNPFFPQIFQPCIQLKRNFNGDYFD